MEWLRQQGATESRSTGPPVDHTTQTSSGYYAYIDASSGSPGDAARLTSSPQTPGKLSQKIFDLYQYTRYTLFLAN